MAAHKIFWIALGLGSGPDGSGPAVRFIWTDFQAERSILDPFWTDFDVWGWTRTLVSHDLDLAWPDLAKISMLRLSIGSGMVRLRTSKLIQNGSRIDRFA